MPRAAFPVAAARGTDSICAVTRSGVLFPYPMKITRRDWLKFTGTAALATQLPRALHAAAGGDTEHFLRDYEQPMFDLPGQVKEPVKIASIEMLNRGSSYFV